MLCINSELTDPFLNLALEEYYFRNSREDFFIAGINDPSVIIGKHQIANEEVNNRFVFERNIPVIRRITGGGTVYHDHGNVNFTFISSGEPGSQINFRKYTEPITDYLVSLNIDARFEGKNDIRTGGVKVSGNAEHVFKNRVLHHGTLLFNSSLSDLRDSLLQSTAQYISRAVASNRTSVTNIAELSPGVGSADELKHGLLEFVMGRIPGCVPFKPSPKDMDEIADLAETRYRRWEWNYAYGPPYRFINRFRFRGRMHCCDLTVNDGIIVASQITGSTLLEQAGRDLRGMRHYYPDIESGLSTMYPDEASEIALSLF
ncbi:MAG: lipoate--protein ligase [Bacteroidales bacterium]|jgi:lipoate-protein ligase A|nr:lipoate--protein ligase [Bacteroidales bacterium]